MPKIHSPRHDTAAEPVPAYASDAEIELAQQLRRELEQRYLGSSSTPSPSRNGASEKQH